MTEQEQAQKNSMDTLIAMQATMNLRLVKMITERIPDLTEEELRWLSFIKSAAYRFVEEK